MNVLFVYSLNRNNFSVSLGHIQFGISYISSFLQKNGHRTNLVVLHRESAGRNRGILRKYIHTFKPELICFTAVATEYNFIAAMASYIKRRYPQIYLLIGGVHVTLNPQEAIGDYFDVLCVGEGERPTLELVSQLEKGGVPSHIPNMWFKRGSGVERNPPREFLQELDSLPFPDRRMWRDWQDQRAAQRCDVLLSRGCPFNCSYCCNHAFRNVSGGNYVRHRSPQNIVKEIKDILAELPKLKEIYLETETITLDTRWCIALCSELEGLNKTLSRPLSFGANVRITPNGNLEDIFSAFKKANFRFVKIGLESGSERVRQEILRRNYSNRDIINSVALARKYGLQINLYNLIGVPGETLSDFEETVAINRICKPDGHMTSIFFPYPGTDLYARCKEEGLLKGLLDTRNERERAVLDLPGFSRKQIQESFYLLDYYIRYDPESGRLRGIHIIFYKLYKRLFSLPLFRNLAGVLKKLSKPNTPFFR